MSSKNSKNQIVIFKNNRFQNVAKPSGPISVIHETIMITPEIAAMFLEKNTQNRKVNKSHKQKFINDIMDNQWQVTGEPISFFIDGVLADGQHRLEAIVATGKTVPAILCFGIEHKAKIAQGAGKARNEEAICKVNGVVAPKNALSAAGFYLQIEKRNGVSRAKLSHRQKIQFYENIKKSVDLIFEKFAEHRNGKKKLPSGIDTNYVKAALFSAHAAGVSIEEIDTFIKVLVTGHYDNNNERFVLDTLREKIISEGSTTSNGGKNRTDMYKYVQKVLSRFVNQETDRGCNMCNKTSKALFEVPEELLPVIHKIKG